ncbi:MAG: putative DNA binding domain-containing protein [Anaerolineae bacterium]|nr:putative DNA binding domain-containing protein [Anaerolineae bacterium]
MDLHLHTPASADWAEPGVTFLDWLYKAETRGLDIIAITDHNTVAGVARMREEIERLTWLEQQKRLRPQERRALDEYRRLGNKLLILPGFEFTATFGFHILGIFPPETPVRELEYLLLKLNVPPDKLDEGSTEVGPTTDVLTAYRLIHEAGGLVIAAHANSANGVAMRDFPFGGQTKIAYTQDPHLHALEVTDLESKSRRATARFFDGSKPEYPRRMHCIQGSDAHRLNRNLKDRRQLGIGDRVTEILLPEVSFEAIKAVFEGNDFALTRPYRPTREPYDHVLAAREQGPNIVQSFHESASRRGGRLHAVLADVVAFANAQGGTVYIGVSGTRKGPPVGVDKPEEVIAMLKQEIQRKVTPPLDVTVDVMESQGRPIVRVVVPEGNEKPYCLDQMHIYVRQEGETNLAVRDEIIDLVRQSMQGVEGTPTQGKVAEAAQEEHKQEESNDRVEPPKVGVQILATVERKGVLYHTLKDLRNNQVVQNVTKASARKLWNYAISQHESNALKPEDVTWRGNIGLWHQQKRAGKLRYDLVQRMPDGSTEVYYGVTEEGMEGPWRQFLPEEE